MYDEDIARNLRLGAQLHDVPETAWRDLEEVDAALAEAVAAREGREALFLRPLTDQQGEAAAHLAYVQHRAWRALFPTEFTVGVPHWSPGSWLDVVGPDVRGNLAACAIEYVCLLALAICAHWHRYQGGDHIFDGTASAINSRLLQWHRGQRAPLEAWRIEFSTAHELELFAALRAVGMTVRPVPKLGDEIGMLHTDGCLIYLECLESASRPTEPGRWALASSVPRDPSSATRYEVSVRRNEFLAVARTHGDILAEVPPPVLEQPVNADASFKDVIGRGVVYLLRVEAGSADPTLGGPGVWCVAVYSDPDTPRRKRARRDCATLRAPGTWDDGPRGLNWWFALEQGLSPFSDGDSSIGGDYAGWVEIGWPTVERYAALRGWAPPAPWVPRDLQEGAGGPGSSSAPDAASGAERSVFRRLMGRFARPTSKP